eukprot:529221_1
MQNHLCLLSFIVQLISSQIDNYIPNDYQWLMEQPSWNPEFTIQYSYTDDNIDQYPFVSTNTLPSLVVYPHWTGIYNQTNTNKQTNFSAYVAQINNNSKLSFEVPTKCSIRQKT